MKDCLIMAFQPWFSAAAANVRYGTGVMILAAISFPDLDDVIDGRWWVECLRFAIWPANQAGHSNCWIYKAWSPHKAIKTTQTRIIVPILFPEMGYLFQCTTPFSFPLLVCCQNRSR